MNEWLVIQNASQSAHVPSHDDLTIWVKKGLQFADNKEIVVRIIDEDEMARLNQQFRGKSGTTNVLSFPTELPGIVDDTPILGDIVICAPVVNQEASEQKKPRSSHWAHMLIHGVLHLQGYDHQHAEEAEVMESLEIQLLSELGIANPYISNDTD